MKNFMLYIFFVLVLSQCRTFDGSSFQNASSTPNGNLVFDQVSGWHILSQRDFKLADPRSPYSTYMSDDNKEFNISFVSPIIGVGFSQYSYRSSWTSHPSITTLLPNPTDTLIDAVYRSHNGTEYVAAVTHSLSKVISIIVVKKIGDAWIEIVRGSGSIPYFTGSLNLAFEGNTGALVAISGANVIGFQFDINTIGETTALPSITPVTANNPFILMNHGVFYTYSANTRMIAHSIDLIGRSMALSSHTYSGYEMSFEHIDQNTIIVTDQQTSQTYNVTKINIGGSTEILATGITGRNAQIRYDKDLDSYFIFSLDGAGLGHVHVTKDFKTFNRVGNGPISNFPIENIKFHILNGQPIVSYVDNSQYINIIIFKDKIDTSKPLIDTFPKPTVKIIPPIYNAPVGIKTPIYSVAEGSVTYSWTVNRSATIELASSATAEITFPSPGNYDISVTVTDNFGRTATDTISISGRNVTVPTVFETLVSIDIDPSVPTDPDLWGKLAPASNYPLEVFQNNVSLTIDPGVDTIAHGATIASTKYIRPYNYFAPYEETNALLFAIRDIYDNRIIYDMGTSYLSPGLAQNVPPNIIGTSTTVGSDLAKWSFKTSAEFMIVDITINNIGRIKTYDGWRNIDSTRDAIEFVMEQNGVQTVLFVGEPRVVADDPSGLVDYTGIRLPYMDKDSANTKYRFRMKGGSRGDLLSDEFQILDTRQLPSRSVGRTVDIPAQIKDIDVSGYPSAGGFGWTYIPPPTP